MNLSNYIEYNSTGCKYELFGVSAHIRKSGKIGHFIAYCKKDIYHQWFKFDDSIVQPVINFNNEVINTPEPCVLFYRKRK